MKKTIKNIKIIDISITGKSVSKYNNKVIFSNLGVPGDLCDIEIKRKRKNYSEGNIIKYHKLSKKRNKPKCEHFGICGGCKYQHIKYTEQLNYKKQQVIETFKKIGEIELPKYLRIKNCHPNFEYKNKAEFTFSNNKWLTKKEINSNKIFKTKNAIGFHIPKRFDKIIHIKQCHLYTKEFNEIRNEIFSFCNKKYNFFDIKNQTGFLRNLTIRQTLYGEIMVIVHFYEENKKHINAILSNMKSKFPYINSLMYVINNKKNDTIHDLEINLFSGKNYIIEKINNIKYHIGPKTFFQTNNNQLNVFFKSILDFGEFKKNEIVYDIYTGIGAIAHYISKKVKQVIGNDLVLESIQKAKETSEINNIKNCSFFTLDSSEILSEKFIKNHGIPDTIIIDPPREGIKQELMNNIMKLKIRKIIYISCNPSTQARDMKILKTKYKLSKFKILDMFPHTNHIETMILMKII